MSQILVEVLGQIRVVNLDLKFKRDETYKISFLQNLRFVHSFDDQSKLAWKTESPFIQATNLESVVFPEPEIPISKR